MTNAADAVRLVARSLGRQSAILDQQRMNVLSASVNTIVHLPADRLAQFARRSARTGAQLDAYAASVTAVARALDGYAAALDDGSSEGTSTALDRIVAVTRTEAAMWAPGASYDRGDVREHVSDQHNSADTADGECGHGRQDVQTAAVDLRVWD